MPGWVQRQRAEKRGTGALVTRLSFKQRRRMHEDSPTFWERPASEQQDVSRGTTSQQEGEDDPHAQS